MALYRCAACGSSRVVVDTKQEGYSKKKGLLGALLLGSGGAAAGINGNTITYYHCSDCGQVLSYPMSDIQKSEIEYALANKNYKHYIERLIELKKKYKNIEWNEDDLKQATKMLNAQAWIVTDEIILQCVEFIKEKSIIAHDDLTAFLTSLGYGENITNQIKSSLAHKDDIPVKFVYKDNKLFYELCYDKTVDGRRTLQHWNIMALRDDASETERREKKFEQNLSEMETAILSLLVIIQNPL